MNAKSVDIVLEAIAPTKEQLEELHPEFITFLATQSIDKKEWEELKRNKPEIAEQEIDVFSDMIWDRAITNVEFIDHFSKNYIFLLGSLGGALMIFWLLLRQLNTYLENYKQ